MEPGTTLLLEISLCVGAVACLCGYGVYWLKKAKSYLTILTSGNGVVALKINKLGNYVDWTDPADKSKIRFPLDLQFGRQAKNGSMRFQADPNTGLLVRYKSIADPDVRSRLQAFAEANGMIVEHEERTGTLVRYKSDAGTFEHLDPKYMMRAFHDGRVNQIARAIKGPALWEQYILPGMIIIGALGAATLFFVYKMYSAARGGG